jgi:hypothetical protein
MGELRDEFPETLPLHLLKTSALMNWPKNTAPRSTFIPQQPCADILKLLIQPSPDLNI